jgi:hypothetical protein
MSDVSTKDETGKDFKTATVSFNKKRRAYLEYLEQNMRNATGGQMGISVSKVIGQALDDLMAKNGFIASEKNDIEVDD